MTEPVLAHRHRLGLLLDAAMLMRDVTSEDLAVAVGVSAVTVRRWRSGNYGISGEYLAPLAAALDLPAELLVDPPATRQDAIVKIAHWDARPDRPAR